MNSTLKYILIGGSIAAVLGGIGLYIWTNIERALDFSFRIIDFKFTLITTSDVMFDLTIEIQNKSDLDIIVDGYEIDVDINDLQLAHIKSTTVVSLKKLSKNTIVVPVSLKKSTFSDSSWNQIKAIGRSYLIDKDSVLVGVKGKASGSSLGVKVKDIPIDVSMTIKEILS